VAGISSQFHALHEELHAFARRLITDFDIHVVGLRYRPFTVTELDYAQLDECFSMHPTFKELYFTISEPVLNVDHELDFRRKNHDALRLDVGALSEHGLRESWLSATTKNPIALATWRKIARQLKKLTTAGATAIQPETGATGIMRNHRFSEGARLLDASGVKLLSLTGIIMKPIDRQSGN
jgi:hypothetical protein